MRCPFCQVEETRVIDSRLAGEGEAVRRRRECIVCQARFTTYETAELTLPRVVKQGENRETFDEHKLRSGMEKALEKCPVPTEKLEEAVARIQRKARETGEREISSQTIGSWVMEELLRLDQVAFIRFASVYRRFQDLNAFREEIDRLQGK